MDDALNPKLIEIERGVWRCPGDSPALKCSKTFRYDSYAGTQQERMAAIDDDYRKHLDDAHTGEWLKGR